MLKSIFIFQTLTPILYVALGIEGHSILSPNINVKQLTKACPKTTGLIYLFFYYILNKNVLFLLRMQNLLFWKRSQRRCFYLGHIGHFIPHCDFSITFSDYRVNILCTRIWPLDFFRCFCRSGMYHWRKKWTSSLFYVMVDYLFLEYMLANVIMDSLGSVSIPGK